MVEWFHARRKLPEDRDFCMVMGETGYALGPMIWHADRHAWFDAVDVQDETAITPEMITLWCRWADVAPPRGILEWGVGKRGPR